MWPRLHEKLGPQLSTRHRQAAEGLHTGILGELVRLNTSVSARFFSIFIHSNRMMLCGIGPKLISGVFWKLSTNAMATTPARHRVFIRHNPGPKNFRLMWTIIETATLYTYTEFSDHWWNRYQVKLMHFAGLEDVLHYINYYGCWHISLNRLQNEK